jgi:anaerobic magnesium-protoporphyrin IX monomethyl ester cyclase
MTESRRQKYSCIAILRLTKTGLKSILFNGTFVQLKYRLILPSFFGEKMKIAFWEAKNNFDPQVKTSTPYRQLKSYLLFHSQYKDDIEFNFYDSISGIPEDVDIVCVSGSSQNFFEIIEAGKAVRMRHPDILLILGGHHISTMPLTLPREFDIGVLFEGEKTFKEIVDFYISSGKTKDFITGQKGIVRHEGGGIKINGQNELIEELDAIPFPVIEDDEPPYLFTSRGCPYNCAFCYSSSFWKKVRFFSAGYVVSEIEYIMEKFPGIKNIIIWDDLVCADRERFSEIVKMMEERKIPERVSFGFAVRANLVDDKMCGLLKRMNVSHVSFGAESGNDRILKILKGERSGVASNQNAINLLNKYGIPVACGFVIGCPSETETELQDTFDFILNNVGQRKIVIGIVNILMPLPGTKMWEYGMENGIIKEPYDWNRFKLFVSYRATRIKSVNEWAEKRIDLDSYYLNGNLIPHERLLESLAKFEMLQDGMIH